MTDDASWIDVSIKVRNYKCFGDEPGGFDRIAPINVIIGRNNSGKSALVDVLELCATKKSSFNGRLHSRGNEKFELIFSKSISEDFVRDALGLKQYSHSVPTDILNLAQRVVGSVMTVELVSTGQINYVEGLDFRGLHPAHQEQVKQSLGRHSQWPLDGYEVLRVAAERDVAKEQRNPTLAMEPNGQGLTNVIRGFISQDNYPRDEVEKKLLYDLNEIYAGDSEFTRISCREDSLGNWEIFLQELHKGEIRLSQSGSSLKSVM